MDKADAFILKTKDVLEELMKDGLTFDEMLVIISQTLGLASALLCQIPESFESKVAIAENFIAHLKHSMQNINSEEQQSHDI